MTQPRHLEAELVADLRPALEGCADPVAFGMGHDGTVFAVARRSSTEPLSEIRGIVAFPKSTLSEPVDWVVARSGAAGVETVTVADLPLVVSYVQPLPGNRLLLAGARCHWRPEGPERNAVIVDPLGRVCAAFTIGDGVQDVRITADGVIWVSYFDEGVFGNYGWHHPGPGPIGAPGLVAFDATGEITFAYDATAARSDDICDAYAMNVTADGAAWVYFYTDFPIVRVQRGTYRLWRTDVAGARALAVHDDRALLFGGYRESSLATVVALAEDGATTVDRVHIRCAGDASLDGARVSGVGDKLVLFQDRQAFVLQGWW
jgi:hypothetical protein